MRFSIDTAPFIYFIEKHEIYLKVVKPVFAEIDSERIEAITSTVTLLEVLVHPFRTNNETLAKKYRKILRGPAQVVVNSIYFLFISKIRLP